MAQPECGPFYTQISRFILLYGTNNIILHLAHVLEKTYNLLVGSHGKKEGNINAKKENVHDDAVVVTNEWH